MRWCEVMGEFAQCLDVAYLEALLDVFPHDGFYQALHVGPLVAKSLHLWKAAIVDVVHKGPFALSIGLGGDALHVNPMILAIFQEGEWIKVYFVVTPCEVRGQFAAEQLGIAACDEDMQVSA